MIRGWERKWRSAVDGLQFGLRVVHEGQGTANACAFFDNAYLELLWRHDDRELQSAVVRPLALWERLRWRQTGASPFGVALRTADVALPIDTWPYAAAFLSPGKSIPIVTAPNAGHEPLIFAHPGTLPIRPRPPQAHRGKHRRLTRVVVFGLAGSLAARRRADALRSGCARDRDRLLSICSNSTGTTRVRASPMISARRSRWCFGGSGRRAARDRVSPVESAVPSAAVAAGEWHRMLCQDSARSGPSLERRERSRNGEPNRWPP